jgi:hypothetical protein
MKVVSLSENGIELARLVKTNHLHYGAHWAFLHGRKDVVAFPLDEHVFRADMDISETQDYRLKSLIPENKFILGRGDGTDTGFLVLWKLSPVLQDRAHYSIYGYASLIAVGSDTDSIPCPVIHVTGPCNLLWFHTSDSCDSDPPILEAACDGQYWIVRYAHYDRIEPFYYGI